MDRSDKYEYVRAVSIGQRLLVALFGLFPLLAPYQLILKVRWESYFNLPFLFVLVICAGAVLVSLSFFFFALMAISSRTTFDITTRMITYKWFTLAFRMQQELWSFDEINRIETEEHEWSDGPPYYLLVLVPNSGKRVSFVKYDMKEEAESECQKLLVLIKGERPI